MNIPHTVFLVAGLLALELHNGEAVSVHHSVSHSFTSHGGSSSSHSSHVVSHGGHGHLMGMIHNFASAPMNNHGQYHNLGAAPMSGAPQSMGGPPMHSAPKPESNEPLARTLMAALSNSSAVQIVLDSLDESVRDLAKTAMTDCLVSSNKAVDMLIDQDVFRNFFNWELRFWKCYSQRQNHVTGGTDECEAGWNVIPSFLMGNTLDFVKGLPIDTVNSNDAETFKNQKWMVSHMIERACYQANQGNLESFQETLDNGVNNPNTPAGPVQQILRNVRIGSLETALQNGEHTCYPFQEAEAKVNVVRDFAWSAGVNCAVFAAMGQTREPQFPPTYQSSARSPPTRSAQLGPAPGK